MGWEVGSSAIEGGERVVDPAVRDGGVDAEDVALEDLVGGGSVERRRSLFSLGSRSRTLLSSGLGFVALIKKSVIFALFMSDFLPMRDFRCCP